MKPGKTNLPVASICVRRRRREIAIDPGDRLALAVDVGKVTGIGGDDFGIFDKQRHGNESSGLAARERKGRRKGFIFVFLAFPCGWLLLPHITDVHVDHSGFYARVEFAGGRG
jgi:hypothetical protein